MEKLCMALIGDNCEQPGAFKEQVKVFSVCPIHWK